jgi:phosphoribosylaminoimidazole carboxylase PurE protein
VGLLQSHVWDNIKETKQVTTGRKPVSALVGIVMGSDTDFPVMSEAGKTLGKFGIAYEMEVLSAHRTPARAHEYATTALKRGLKVLIAAAGAAAHLAGVMAANTTLPVIGVPMATSTLNGLDALLATVQMPGGIPVATMAIDKAGAVNSAIFAAQILALSDPEIARKLEAHKQELVNSVAEKNARLQKQISENK